MTHEVYVARKPLIDEIMDMPVSELFILVCMFIGAYTIGIFLADQVGKLIDSRNA